MDSIACSELTWPNCLNAEKEQREGAFGTKTAPPACPRSQRLNLFFMFPVIRAVWETDTLFPLGPSETFRSVSEGRGSSHRYVAIEICQNLPSGTKQTRSDPHPHCERYEAVP